MVRYSRILIALGIAIATVGCGLPDPLREQAEQLSAEIEATRTAVQERAEAYTAFSASDEFEFFEPYAEQGRWAEALDQAQQLVEAADSAYRQPISVLLEEDRSADAATLGSALLRVQQRLAEARQRAAGPAEGRHFIETARDSASAWVREGTARLDATDAPLDSLGPVVTKAGEDFPQKTDDLQQRWTTLTRARDSLAAWLTAAGRVEAASADGRTADYAALAGAIASIRATHGELVAASTDLESRAGQLYRSYSRVLVDMRQEFFVEVSRTSWDNGSDAQTETNYIYPARHVSLEVYEYLLSRPADDVLAEYDDGLFGDRRSVRIEPEIWQALEVDWKARWPDAAHDAAGYWLGTSSTRGYHRYLMLENGDSTVTDWVEVDGDTYASHIDHLGMAILAKPYGLYEDETITSASPPGMAYVGNPRYGEWRESGGRSTWHWIGQYAFMAALLGGSPFHFGRSDWNCWQGYRSRGQAYYGCGGNTPVYGTWGRMTRGSPRYRGTTFAGRGGFRRPAPSVRSAGPIGRGRGPAGGGK